MSGRKAGKAWEPVCQSEGRVAWPKPPLTFWFDLSDGALGQRALPQAGDFGWQLAGAAL